jgi:hypothetical protein
MLGDDIGCVTFHAFIFMYPILSAFIFNPKYENLEVNKCSSSILTRDFPAELFCVIVSHIHKITVSAPSTMLKMIGERVSPYLTPRLA